LTRARGRQTRPPDPGRIVASKPWCVRPRLRGQVGLARTLHQRRAGRPDVRACHLGDTDHLERVLEYLFRRSTRAGGYSSTCCDVRHAGEGYSSTCFGVQHAREGYSSTCCDVRHAGQGYSSTCSGVRHAGQGYSSTCSGVRHAGQGYSSTCGSLFRLRAGTVRANDPRGPRRPSQKTPCRPQSQPQLGLSELSQQRARPPRQPHTPPCREQHPGRWSQASVPSFSPSTGEAAES
jgi:hypothetical protein